MRSELSSAEPYKALHFAVFQNYYAALLICRREVISGEATTDILDCARLQKQPLLHRDKNVFL